MLVALMVHMELIPRVEAVLGETTFILSVLNFLY